MVISIVEGVLGIQGTVSGTDQTLMSLTSAPVHGVPNILRVWIENPGGIPTTVVNSINTATGTITLDGVDGNTVLTDAINRTITVSGFKGEFIAASGSLQNQINSIDSSVTLQESYDNGTGVIQTTAGKPVVISGAAGEDFRVVGSGTFTEALTVGTGSTYLNDHSIATASGVFTNTLTVSGIPVNTISIDSIYTALASTASGSSGSSLLGFPSVSGIAGSSLDPTAEGAETLFSSAGWVSGGEFVNLGDGTITVSGGIGGVRTSNSSLAQLVAFGWDEVPSLAIPSGTVRYIGVNYDSVSDTATVLSKSSDTWNYHTEFPLGFVSNREGVVHTIEAPQITGDGINLINQRIGATARIQRDNTVGGLIVGETGTRNITLSAGDIWVRLVSFPISAIDTSAGGGFTTYYRDGLGGFVKTQDVTQWPNTQYDDGSGTLVTLGNNRYSVLWFYVEVDGHLAMLYGRGSYPSAAAAENEVPPNTVPTGLDQEALLVSRLIFQENSSTATSIQSTFSTVFSTQGVTDHGNLIGLTDDDHTQYILTNGTRAFTGTIGGITPTSSTHLATKGYVDTQDVTISGFLQSNIDSINVDEIEPAIVGQAGITVTSGSNTITISGVSDHDQLAGLSDDDHAQYLNLNGRTIPPQFPFGPEDEQVVNGPVYFPEVVGVGYYHSGGAILEVSASGNPSPIGGLIPLVITTTPGYRGTSNLFVAYSGGSNIAFSVNAAGSFTTNSGIVLNGLRFGGSAALEYFLSSSNQIHVRASSLATPEGSVVDDTGSLCLSRANSGQLFLKTTDDSNTGWERMSKESFVTTTSGYLQNQIDSDVILRNGSQSFTGNQSLGGFDLTNVGNITAVTGTFTESLTVSGSAVLTTASTQYKSITVGNPRSTENISFFFTPQSITFNKVIPTISGLAADSGITWSIRYATDRSNHTGAAELVTGGSNTNYGNTGIAIETFDNPNVPSDSYIWVETTSSSGTLAEMSLNVIF